MTTPGSPLAYRPELNGVRAIAVWLVVIQHWASPPVMMGEMGRQLFFVLSGYLIAGIVWKQQVYPGAPGPWRQRLGTFYKRRVLRIIPPYYCLLAVSALLPLETVRDYPVWFMLPAANLLFYRMQHWGEGCGHLWTLAVDEQFYLVWPLLLGLVGQRRNWLLAIGALGLAFRIGWSAYVTPGFILVLLPSSLDLFAAGTLLRLFEKSPSLARWTRGYMAVLAWGVWWLLWGLFTQVRHDGGELWLIIFPTVGAVAAFVTLAWLLRNPGGARRVGMHNRLLLWMGRRSFGLYLYHLLLPVFYQRAVYHLWSAESGWRELMMGPLPTVLVLSPMLIALSAASWYFIEAPLERVKKNLAYAPTAAIAPAHS
ncbi:acyltransferase [Hymenobacter taeanensis]|uniref:Acyltransferase n=1 Tax=Hymenobacter taeanensis TaxID=2735321 RepID=A0A6M6BI88_9BACT|nr:MULTISPECIES: acyltransferase [Hymenobacter]QJX46765.1 acyltransferase [Hymenobacter taeanensis]UOQ80633.1 acyltransferase [Hymenobacter sp. 5414T-23]